MKSFFERNFLFSEWNVSLHLVTASFPLSLFQLGEKWNQEILLADFRRIEKQKAKQLSKFSNFTLSLNNWLFLAIHIVRRTFPQKIYYEVRIHNNYDLELLLLTRNFSSKTLQLTESTLIKLHHNGFPNYFSRGKTRKLPTHEVIGFSRLHLIEVNPFRECNNKNKIIFKTFENFLHLFKLQIELTSKHQSLEMSISECGKLKTRKKVSQ